MVLWFPGFAPIYGYWKLGRCRNIIFWTMGCGFCFPNTSERPALISQLCHFHQVKNSSWFKSGSFSWEQLAARTRATSNIETSEEPQVGQLGSASRFWGWRIFIFPPTWFASHYYPFLLVDILTSAGQNQHLSSSSSSFIFLYFVRTVIQSHAVARDQFSWPRQGKINPYCRKSSIYPHHCQPRPGQWKLLTRQSRRNGRQCPRWRRSLPANWQYSGDSVRYISIYIYLYLNNSKEV